MRILAVMAAAAVLSAEAPPPEIKQFDQAFEAARFEDAMAVATRLIEERTPKDGQPRPDPLLNSLLGRLMLAGNQSTTAALVLGHVNFDQLPAGMRTETALAYGRALELTGNRKGALQAYRTAAAFEAGDAQHRKALLGIARQLLASDPAAVPGQIGSLANEPLAPDRWEARYLLALSSSLLGDTASAARYADQAWSDAPNALASDLAPLHVGALKAGLAAVRGDIAGERAMLAATNGLGVSAAGSLSSQLPVCGDDGLQPSDTVTFAIVQGPYATRDLVPVAASRPAAVAPFQDRLNGFVLVNDTDSQAPVGTVVTVSCRSSVEANFGIRPDIPDPLLEWFHSRGLYQATASGESSDKNINLVADRVASLERRFGKESILLIAPRWQLLNLLEVRARLGDAIPPGRLSDLRNDIANGLKAAGAPAWLSQGLSIKEKAAEIAQASSPSEGIALFETVMRDQLAGAPFEISRSFLSMAIGGLDDDRVPSSLSRLVVALNSRAPKNLDMRQRQAWLLTVARAQRLLGRKREARDTLASAGLEKDVCAASDSRPQMLEQHFSYEDYPPDLIYGEQEGAVLFDFTINSAGSVTNPRILYSLPSGLFDQASRKGVAGIQYAPAMRDGKAVSCRGTYQPLIWRLQDESDVWTPSLTPTIPAQTT
jgi:TonB family protein